MDQASFFGSLAEQIHPEVLNFGQFRIDPGFDRCTRQLANRELELSRATEALELHRIPAWSLEGVGPALLLTAAAPANPARFVLVFHLAGADRCGAPE